MDNTTKKGIGLLEILAHSEDPRGVSELARETGLTRSNVQRTLQTLCELGYAQKDEASGRYKPTLRQWEMGVKALLRLPAVRAARAHLLALRAKTGESSVLCLLDHNDVIYVNKLESETPIRMSCSVGTRLPLYSVATGRVMAAFLSSRDKSTAIASLPDSLDKDAFERRLTVVAQRGYEISEGGFRAGINSIAAPIWQGDQICASIGISGPEERLTPERLAEWLPNLLDAGARISEALGHRERANTEPTLEKLFARE